MGNLFGAAAMFAVLVLFITMVVLLANGPNRDNSDGANRRSGMIIRTDCLTGLQYLSSTRGSLTPRMGADGKQVVDRSSCH